jgi:hypothetical protein
MDTGTNDTGIRLGLKAELRSQDRSTGTGKLLYEVTTGKKLFHTLSILALDDNIQDSI